jgi:hypothetical protein
MLMDRDGTYAVRPGYTPMASSGPGARILGSVFFRDLNNIPVLVAATATNWYSFNFATEAWTDITGNANAGDSTTHVRFVTFQQANKMWAIGVNDTDTTRRWDSTTAAYVDIAAAPIARDIEVLADRVVCVNTIETAVRHPNRVRWSSSADATTWGANNFIDLPDAGDPIVGILNLSRTTAAIYRKQSIWGLAAQPGGDASAFRVQRLAGGAGAVSPAAIVKKDGIQYYFATDQKVYVFDGVRQQVISGQIHPFIKSNYDSQFNNLTHAGFYPERRLVFWCFVRQDAGDNNPKAAIFYDIDRRAWEVEQRFADGITDTNSLEEPTAGTWKDMTGTWASPDSGFTSWDSVPGTDTFTLILGTDAGQVHRFGSNANDNGTDITFSWKSPLLFGDPRQTLLYNEVESYFTQPSSVQDVSVEVRGYEQPLDTGEQLMLSSHNIRATNRFRDNPELPFITYLPGLQVNYSGTTSDYSLVAWAGSAVFVNPERER